jgi:peptide deformylase
MSIISLVQLDRVEFENKDVSLRKPSEEVSDFSDDFQKKIDDLLDTFWSHKIAVGLAAPQIGMQLKLAVINHKRDKAAPMLIIVNPKILSTSGKKDKKKESCMSLPDYAGDVERRTKLVLRYQDRYGEPQQMEAEGFLARVIQHEVDHLEGYLYIDRMKDLSKLETTDIFKND